MGNEADAAARRAARKPWWLPSTDVRQCLKMAGAYLAVAVAAFVTSFFVSQVAPARMFAGLWLLVSVYCLGWGLLLRRRATRHGQAGKAC